MKNKLYVLLLCFALGLTISSCGNSQDKPKADTLPKDSLTVINELIRNDPANLDLYVRRSKVYMNKKDYTSSLADMERVVSIDSNKAEYLLAAADINFFTNHVLRTDSLLSRAVRLNPENTDCILRLAQLMHYLTNYNEEQRLLDQALKVDVRNAQAYFMKGMLFKDLRDTDKAISSMQTAVEQDPDHYNAYMQLGLLTAASNNPLAEEYYLNAIKINPGSQEAIYGLALFYQQTQNWNRAIETYTSLLKLNPHYFDAHFNLGIIHATKLDVVDQAMNYFNMAIEDDPKNPRGYYGRGYCFEKKGDVKNAEADYRKALEVDPDYTNAAEALNKLGK